MTKLISTDPNVLRQQGWMCLDDDKETGISQWSFYDVTKGTLQLITLGDAAKLKARNRAMQAENQNKRWGDGKLTASVPAHLWDALFLEAEQNKDMEYIAKKLADPDFADLRTFRSEF